MKNLHLLIWLTELGLSTVLPLTGFILLALWLKEQQGWGDWVIWVAVILGGICAVDGFLHSLKSMQRMAKNNEEKEAPPISFNDHD